MRRISIVFLALLAYCSAYPVEETPDVALQVPESASQVPETAVADETANAEVVVLEAEKNAAAPESDTEPSNAEQLLEVDTGVPASPELVREARQFIGFGGYPGYGGYGRYPGYGGFGGFSGYGGYGYGRYPGYGGYGGFGRFPYGYLG
ncbi:dnaJ homolog subfamily C member 7 homolog [Ceratitis capitata]|uniref:dnaJ homolog subfamily C member 7 homolog n=1 Tax=Ceratitis capitata TaxID=7213 RepID=UPI000329EC68|nr:dnaJ homolog subfamily C member 7 homolog [Ceratitis capitata]